VGWSRRSLGLYTIVNSNKELLSRGGGKGRKVSRISSSHHPLHRASNPMVASSLSLEIRIGMLGLLVELGFSVG
jgi:hypothetical protein